MKFNLKISGRFFLIVLLCSFNFQNLIAQSGNSRPNILLIITDDMSYKMLDIYNQDTFIHTPGIDRIGNEGVIVKYYSTNALCVPGRSSLLTGKYGHNTGVMNNSSFPDQNLATIPKILNDQGYYTAMIGKWMLGDFQHKPEFDYWLWTPNATTYFNDTIVYFDTSFIVQQHLTDFITDSAIQLLSRIDTPFFMMLSYNAPHYPYYPQLQFDHKYDSSFFSYPLNWLPFTKNYPSFLYDSSNTINGPQSFQNSIKNYYELMYGVEVSVGKILDSLEFYGMLDSTMVIFTTDNGFLFGEHRLRGKSFPYEECMRLPLYIRYPEWFPSGSVIDSSISLNIDIAPTILEAVGIADTFNMDGISIHSVLTNQFKRTKFLYEQRPENSDSISSTVRTYRDNYFQYNRYYCSDTTEELFNIILDPFQKINLVHHYLYQDTLNIYRIKLDSIRINSNDTMLVSSNNCYLDNPVFTFELPTCSLTKINETCDLGNGSIELSMQTGTAPFSFIWSNSSTSEDLVGLISGAYYVTVTDNNSNTVSASIFVSNINAPVLYESHVDATFSNSDGSINLTAVGQSHPFSYNWSNGSTNQDLHEIPAGNYAVTVTDTIGCVSIMNITINSVEIQDTSTEVPDFTGPFLNNLIKDSDLSHIIILYPNPAYSLINISSENLRGEYNVELYNGYGIIIRKMKLNFGSQSKQSINLDQLLPGIYFIRLENGDKNFIISFSIMN